MGMQLRVFVKTKFSGGACPQTPPPPVAKLRAYGARADRFRRRAYRVLVNASVRF